MKAFDLTKPQILAISDAAEHWATWEGLPDWALLQHHGETFGEWLAGYLSSLAPAPEPSLLDLQRDLDDARKKYQAARRLHAGFGEAHLATLHAKLIQARAAYIGARAMADAKKVTS